MGEKSDGIDFDQAYIDARTALLQAANSEDPMTRSYAMEALGQTLKKKEGDFLLEALSDPSVIVRFSAAMSLGDIRYTKAKKKLEELIELHQAGLSRMHIGLESGYDPVLQFMDKGVTATEHVAAGRKVVASSISLSEYVVLGLGGKRMWR